MKYLNSENTKLRNELKILNDALSYLIDYVKTQKQKKNPYQKQTEEDVEFKMKVKVKQIDNYEKVLRTLDEEHMKLT